MFFENHHAKIERTFQEIENITSHRFYFENVNVLLNKNKKMKVDLTLIKTTMMIFMKSIYMSTLLYQKSRRI